MNQSIIFPDIHEWNEESKVVEFPAQQAGSLIMCTISIEKLMCLSESRVATAVDVLALFSQYRFDIEDIAEEMIEGEMFNALDQIAIT